MMNVSLFAIKYIRLSQIVVLSYFTAFMNNHIHIFVIYVLLDGGQRSDFSCDSNAACKASAIKVHNLSHPSNSPRTPADAELTQHSPPSSNQRRPPTLISRRGVLMGLAAAAPDLPDISERVRGAGRIGLLRNLSAGV